MKKNINILIAGLAFSMVFHLVSCVSAKEGSAMEEKQYSNKEADKLAVGILKNEKKDKARLQEMGLEIVRMIGEARCENVSECKVIAFGSKPCGGPWRFLPHNLSGSMEDTLKLKVNNLNIYETKMNIFYEYTSDCMYVSAPEVYCYDGQCKTEIFK